MLHRHITPFLDYCQLADFSIRSIQALSIRLNEFDIFLKTQRIRSVKSVRYRHLIGFAADYNSPSIHVTKSRVWALRQFYQFLTLHRIVPENIATGLPYPKIEKTVPQFLTIEEYTRLLCYFTDRSDSPMGLRNLVIIMLLGTLGLRTATLNAINIEDADLTCGLLWIKEKGRRQRSVVLPHCICKIIRDYLQPRRRKKRTVTDIQTQKTHLPAHTAGYLPHCGRSSRYR
jgi:site-specific recombinase XerD